jgi:hypothetical protein
VERSSGSDVSLDLAVESFTSEEGIAKSPSPARAEKVNKTVNKLKLLAKLQLFPFKMPPRCIRRIN